MRSLQATFWNIIAETTDSTSNQQWHCNRTVSDSDLPMRSLASEVGRTGMNNHSSVVEVSQRSGSQAAGTRSAGMTAGTNINVYNEGAQSPKLKPPDRSRFCAFPVLVFLKNESLKKMKIPVHHTGAHQLLNSHLGFPIKLYDVPVQLHVPKGTWHQEEEVLRHQLIIHVQYSMGCFQIQVRYLLQKLTFYQVK